MTKIMIVLFLTMISFVIAAKDYGYFDSIITDVSTCQGPKRNDCCVNTLSIKTENLLAFDVNCKEKFTPTKSKIVASVENRQKLRLQMNKPCNHLFIKPIILSVFNATDDCTISKNVYRFTLDFTEIAQKYYSGMFLYGNWTFQSVFFNDKCNFLCMVLNVNVYPKK